MASATEDTESLFLSLPPELRNNIYELVLAHDESIKLGVTIDRARTSHKYQDSFEALPKAQRAQYKPPSLLQTCRLIRNEASQLYYVTNTFLAGWWLPAVDPVHKWRNAHLKEWYESNFVEGSNLLPWLESLEPAARSHLRQIHFDDENTYETSNDGYEPFLDHFNGNNTAYDAKSALVKYREQLCEKGLIDERCGLRIMHRISFSILVAGMSKRLWTSDPVGEERAALKWLKDTYREKKAQGLVPAEGF